MTSGYDLSGRRDKKAIAGFLALPIVVHCIFCFFPTLVTLIFSLFKWNGISDNIEFVGLQNFINLFTANSTFKTSIVNTLIYQVSIFQLYRLMDSLRLINNLFGLILVYTAWGLPFTVYVMYGFMSSIPVEIQEAAQMDGCSMWGMYSRIIMPLSATVVASSIIFNMVFVWNDLNFPMILVDDPNLKSLSNALLSFRGQYSSQYTLLFAGVVLASIPLVVVFLLLQKKFTAGMMAGSIKG